MWDEYIGRCRIFGQVKLSGSDKYARNEKIYLKTSSLDTHTLNIKFQLLKKKKSKARRKENASFFPHTLLPTHKKELSSPLRIEYPVIEDGWSGLREKNA